MNETQLTAVGTVVTAVQRHQFGSGMLKATFRMACNERRFSQPDGTWVDGDSLYLTVVCWRALADHVSTSLSVGDPVIVRGRLRMRQFDRDGRQATVTEIEATAAGPDLTRSKAVVTRMRQGVAVAAGARPVPPREAVPAHGGDGAAAGLSSGPLVDYGGDGAPRQRVGDIPAPDPAEAGVGR